ncbi:MAG: radical SAM protein, partial [bacterium]|nr:radical SAM protein [bacterium]
REDLTGDFSYVELRGFAGSEGKPFVSQARPPVKNLDNLQIPDRSLMDYEKYSPFIAQAMVKNSISLQFSRGCVYDCAYCFKIWAHGYANRSAENIFEEIHMYYKMGVRRFGFVDDLPNFNVKESAKLFRLILRHRLKLHLHFPNGIRGDILSKDYIDLMAEAGTVAMDLALETTSPRLQRLIRKHLNLDRLRENMVYIIETYPHIILGTQLIHGLPSETREEANESLEFIKSLRWIHFPYIHLLTIYPNTQMARLAEE